MFAGTGHTFSEVVGRLRCAEQEAVCVQVSRRDFQHRARLFEGRCNVLGVASANGKALVGLGGKELLIGLHLLVAHQLFSFGLGCVIKYFLCTTVFELLQSLHHISIGFCELPAGEFMSDGLSAGLCFLPVVVTVSDKVGGR